MSGTHSTAHVRSKRQAGRHRIPGLQRRDHRNDANYTVEALECRRLLSTLMFPEGLSVVPGEAINVPLLIQQAQGLQAADLFITYDTSRLDLQEQDVIPGTLPGAGWSLDAAVDDASGRVAITLYTAGEPLPDVSGALVSLVFRVPADAPLGSAGIVPEGSLNEAQLSATFVAGSIEIAALTARVSAPVELILQRHQPVQIPILAGNVSGLQAADISISYDTDRFDLVEEGVLHGDLIDSSWQIEAFVDDAAGVASITVYATGSVLNENSGTLLNLAFTVADAADDGLSAIGLWGQLNEGQLRSSFDDGSILLVSPSATVSIPDGLESYRGRTIRVPVHIENAEGLQAADLLVTYDSSRLDLTAASIFKGTLLNADWFVDASVDDAAGIALLTVFSATDPLSKVSGDLLYLDFSVPAAAELGAATVNISGTLNEGLVLATFVPGAVEVIQSPTAVSIPSSVQAHRGEVANVPVMIEHALGLQAANLVITYDTSLLDLSAADVSLAGLLPADWMFDVFVDDSAGIVNATVFSVGEPLGDVSGNLLNLAFHVPYDAVAGIALITLHGELNEGLLPATFLDGQVQVVVDPVLSISGDRDHEGQPDIIRLARNPLLPEVLDVFINAPGATPTASYYLGGISRIVVNGLAGSDQIVLDLSQGEPFPTAIDGEFLGGVGDDTLVLIGTAGDDVVTFKASKLAIGVRGFAFAQMEAAIVDTRDGSDTLTIAEALAFMPQFIGGSGDDRLSILAGQYAITGDLGTSTSRLTLAATGDVVVDLLASQHLWGLDLAGSARVAFPGSERFLDVRSLPAVQNDAVLDLAGNGLIVHSTAAAREADLSSLHQRIGAARNADPLWSGPGITSSSAAAMPMTGLTVVLNDDGSGKPVFDTFSGEPIGVDDLLVRHAWNGDRDFSGAVDALDYFELDRAFLTGPSSHIDLDHNGRLDGDDYMLMDMAFMSQTHVLSPAAAQAPVPSAASAAAGQMPAGVAQPDGMRSPASPVPPSTSHCPGSPFASAALIADTPQWQRWEEPADEDVWDACLR